MKRTPIAAVGTWVGGGLVTLLLVYLAALTLMTARGLPFPPADPFATTFHVIMMLAGLALVPLWSAIHLAVPDPRRVYSLVSLMFAVTCAVFTCANRFVALTMVRQSPDLGRTVGLEWFQPYGWPSLTFAFEMLAWGVFFSLSCLFLVPAFRGHGRGIAVAFAVTGTLSLGGAVGLVLNSTTLMGMVAPVAWGLGPAVAVTLVVSWLRAQPHETTPHETTPHEAPVDEPRPTRPSVR